MSNTGAVQVADAFTTKPPVWRPSRYEVPGASTVTCAGQQLLFKTPTGALSMTDFYGGYTPLPPRVSKAIDVKAFTDKNLLMLDPFGSYNGLVSSGTIAWTPRSLPSTTKRIAAASGLVNRFVVVVKQDNSFWLSRNGGTSFEPLESSLDATWVGTYLADLEIIHRSPDSRSDPMGLYIFALVNGPSGPQIYRGFLEGVW